MTKLGGHVVEAAIRAAFVAWSQADAARRTWERLCRVDPGAGFPQGSTELTAFAAALFAECADCVREADDRIVRVTYRGVAKPDQQPLNRLIQTRLVTATLESKEHGTLDFALLSARASPSVPHPIRLGFESEMRPISGPGTDPDELAADLVKLALIDAEYKVFLGRTNGGSESDGVGGYSPKWTRMRPVLESCLNFVGNRALESVAIVLETQRRSPWRCEILHRARGQAVVAASVVL